MGADTELLMGILNQQIPMVGPVVNAPAFFQRALDVIFSCLQWKTCLVYLCDVIVFSRTVGDKIRHIREVFLLLKKSGVSLKSSNCHFFQQEVEYLGHIVRPGQLLMNQIKHQEPGAGASAPQPGGAQEFPGHV